MEGLLRYADISGIAGSGHEGDGEAGQERCKHCVEVGSWRGVVGGGVVAVFFGYLGGLLCGGGCDVGAGVVGWAGVGDGVACDDEAGDGGGEVLEGWGGGFAEKKFEEEVE